MFLRRVFRCCHLSIHIVWGVLLLTFAVSPNPELRGRRDWQVINGWMVGLCKVLGLRIRLTGQPQLQGPTLFVSNHISWHDIPVIQSLVPTGFIAKAEIRRWPIIGWMAYRGKTLFVHRGQHTAFHEIKHGMQQRFSNQQNMLIFPESTVSNGDTVLTFRTRMYEPAIDHNVPIQAIAVYYSNAKKTCRELAFQDNESFFQHALRLMGEPYIDVDVKFCEPILPEQRERRELGIFTQQLVTDALVEHKSKLAPGKNPA